MGKIIYNKGFKDTIIKQTNAPTINFIEKDGENITVTFTNNSGSEATISYGLSSPPNDDTVVLAASATSNNVVFSGLDDNTSYTIFASANGTPENLIESSIVSITQNTPEIIAITLGVEWDQSTDSLTRLDDAVGLTAGGDFDDKPQYQLRRCMVNDDLSINYFIDPNDPTKIGEVVNTGSYTTGNNANYTGSDGQVMVEIPKFFWKHDEPTSNQYQWRISDVAQAGYDVHPAFITDGVTKDYIYMSAFEADVDGTELTSISGVQPDTNRNIGTYRTYAQNRGTGWQMQTYWGTHALQILYLIEYADYDTQTTIGRGYVNAPFGTGNNSINTGDTISLGNASGAASGTDGFSAISYRGVENFWGNIYKWVDGLNIQNNEAYVANENFASDVFSGDYTSVGSLATSIDYVSDIQFPHFLATETSGSSTSHLYDYYYQKTGNQSAIFGGSWNVGFLAGGFSWILSSDFVEGRGLGSRLQIL